MTNYTPDRIRALCDGATPGPWTVDGEAPLVIYVWSPWRIICARPSDADAAFIAASREIVPQLLARVQALTDEHTRMRIMLHELTRLTDWMNEGYTIEQFRAFIDRGVVPPLPERMVRNGDE